MYEQKWEILIYCEDLHTVLNLLKNLTNNYDEAV